MSVEWNGVSTVHSPQHVTESLQSRETDMFTPQQLVAFWTEATHKLTWPGEHESCCMGYFLFTVSTEWSSSLCHWNVNIYQSTISRVLASVKKDAVRLFVYTQQLLCTDNADWLSVTPLSYSSYCLYFTVTLTFINKTKWKASLGWIFTHWQ